MVQNNVVKEAERARLGSASQLLYYLCSLAAGEQDLPQVVCHASSCCIIGNFAAMSNASDLRWMTEFVFHFTMAYARVFAQPYRVALSWRHIANQWLYQSDFNPHHKTMFWQTQHNARTANQATLPKSGSGTTIRLPQPYHASTTNAAQDTVSAVSSRTVVPSQAPLDPRTTLRAMLSATLSSSLSSLLSTSTSWTSFLALVSKVYRESSTSPLCDLGNVSPFAMKTCERTPRRCTSGCI